MQDPPLPPSPNTQILTLNSKSNSPRVKLSLPVYTDYMHIKLN